MDEAARLRVVIQAMGLRETQRDLGRLDRDLNRTERAAHRSASAIARIGKGAAIAGVGGLTLGFGAAVRAGFKFNAQMESNELAMRRFIGSTLKTRRYLKNLADLAERSPFELTQLTQGARRMMAFGISADQTRKTLTATADAIAAAGGNAESIDRVTLALGQMATKGKVSAEELLQLNEAGIPATKILKRELELTNEEIGNIGKLGIDSGKAIKALTRGMSRDFKGASLEQSRTWDGMMSTLRDKWARTSGSMTRSLFDEAKKWAPRIADTLDRFDKIFRRKDLDFGEKLEMSAGALKKTLLEPIGNAIGKMQLGEKLASAFARAAPKAVEALWNGFKEMPTAGKVLTVGLLLKWLGGGGGRGGVFFSAGRVAGTGLAGGISAGLLSAASDRLATKGGMRGKLGRLFSARGSTPANPLFVSVVGGGVPGAGGPAGGGTKPGTKTAPKGVRGRLGGARGAGLSGVAATLALQVFGDKIPAGMQDKLFGKTPEQQRAAILAYARRKGIAKGGVGLGGAGLSYPGSGLGGLPRPRGYVNPNEGGAQMDGAANRRRRRRRRRSRRERYEDSRPDTGRLRSDPRVRLSSVSDVPQLVGTARQRTTGLATRVRPQRIARSDLDLNVGNVPIPAVAQAKSVHTGDVVVHVHGVQNAKEFAAELAAIQDHARKTHGAAKARARAGKKRRH